MHAAHCIVCDISFAIFTRFHLSSGVEMKMCAFVEKHWEALCRSGLADSPA